MLLGCSKVRLILKLSYANKFSLVGIALLKNIFGNKIFIEISRKGGNSFLCCKKTMVNHT
jgi:hypothetical protein